MATITAMPPAQTPENLLERLKQLHPKVIDLALDRVRLLLDDLGNPEQHLPPVVHVAGTNGKGSTLATLRAMAEAAGQKVHVYISPHLVHFAERITVASAVIAETELTDLLAECETANQGRPITFFEITTAAALLAFSRRPADLCLLETGLGGRWDATNVVERPALTLITAISFDHQAFLGDTLAAIAGEKAGIIKPGAPCLSLQQPPEAMAVIRSKAAQLGAALLVEEEDWQIRPEGAGLSISMGPHRLDLPLPALPGRHQWRNAGLAVAAALTLPGRFAISDGLRRVRWPARLQRLTAGPLPALLPAGWELWLDGGHNPGAGQVLAEHAAGEWRNRPLYLVVGMLNSKDSRGFIDPLAPFAARVATVAIPGEPNSLSAAEMAKQAERAGLPAEPMADLRAAVTALGGRPGPARVLICGSLYLAGAVLRDNS